MALQLISSGEAEDFNGIGYSVIVWLDTGSGLYHAKVRRVPLAQDTADFATVAAAEAAAKVLATSLR